MENGTGDSVLIADKRIDFANQRDKGRDQLRFHFG